MINAKRSKEVRDCLTKDFIDSYGQYDWSSYRLKFKKKCRAAMTIKDKNYIVNNRTSYIRNKKKISTSIA